MATADDGSAALARAGGGVTAARAGARPGAVARVLRGIRSKPLGAVGGFLVTALVATALLAPVLAPHDPIRIQSGNRLRPPSLTHPLGTDDFGRDILSRVIFG